MRLLLFMANLNTSFRKAAAPNNGVAAFFFSTNYNAFHYIMPFFEGGLFAANASKKAMQGIGHGLHVMAKYVA